MGRYLRGQDAVTSGHMQPAPVRSVTWGDNRAGTVAIQKCATQESQHPKEPVAAPCDVTRVLSRDSATSLGVSGLGTLLGVTSHTILRTQARMHTHAHTHTGPHHRKDLHGALLWETPLFTERDVEAWSRAWPSHPLGSHRSGNPRVWPTSPYCVFEETLLKKKNFRILNNAEVFLYRYINISSKEHVG